jgi:hypothetical protein
VTDDELPESGDRFTVRDNTFTGPVHFGSGRQVNWHLKSAVGVGAALSLAAAGIVVFALHPWRSAATASVALAQLSLVTPDRNAIIPESATALGVPPAYPESQKEDHCSLWWSRWLVQQGAADAGSPPLIEISAPGTAAATVTAASVEVYRAYRPQAVTEVECVYGAGAEPGTLLNVNLDRPNAPPTIVSDSGQEVPMAMPYAVISVDASHTEYIAVTPAGSGQFYDWSVKLTVVVDQRSRTYSFGSAARPLHSWLGPRPTRAYDFDFSTRSWRVPG